MYINVKEKREDQRTKRRRVEAIVLMLRVV